MDWKTLLGYGLKVAIILGVLELVSNATRVGIWVTSKLPALGEGSTNQAVGERLGALISSLPFVTILIMVGLWLTRQGDEKIANHAWYTFWFVLPTLPMFLLMPWMMNRGSGFWWALLAGVVLTFLCFVLTAVLARKLGVVLW